MLDTRIYRVRGLLHGYRQRYGIGRRFELGLSGECRRLPIYLRGDFHVFPLGIGPGGHLFVGLKILIKLCPVIIDPMGMARCFR